MGKLRVLFSLFHTLLSNKFLRSNVKMRFTFASVDLFLLSMSIEVFRTPD